MPLHKFHVRAFGEQGIPGSGGTKLLSRAATAARFQAERDDRRYEVVDETGRVVFRATPGQRESVAAWRQRQGKW